MNADCTYCRGLGLDPNADPAGLCPQCTSAEELAKDDRLMRAWKSCAVLWPDLPHMWWPGEGIWSPWGVTKRLKDRFGWGRKAS